jgi:peptidoglycan/LPS O-acetylase OafA/YrhL
VDALRGFAALMVLLAHALDMTIKDCYGPDARTYPPVWHFISAVFGHGEFWVWGFFLISGYCIHLSIKRDLARSSFNVARFLLARLTRLYPLYLIGLAIAVFGSGLPGFREESAVPLADAVLYSLTMMQGLLGYFSGFGASWSLTFELIYYFVWPLALSLAGWSWWRALALSLGLSALNTLVFDWIWRSTGSVDHSLPHMLWQVTAFYPLWLAGVAMAELRSQLIPRVTRAWWLAAMPVLFGFLGCLSYVRDNHGRGCFAVLLSYLTVPCFALIILGARHAVGLSSARGRAVCTWLGVLSYPCYILHHPLLHCWDAMMHEYVPVALLSSAAMRSAILLIPILAIVVAIGPPLERITLAWRRRLLSALDSPGGTLSPSNLRAK